MSEKWHSNIRLDMFVVLDLLDRPGGTQSVLVGGCVPGWSPEVAVVLWRRILGCLGNINNIRDVSIHEEVYEYLCDLVNTLVKVVLNVWFSQLCG